MSVGILPSAPRDVPMDDDALQRASIDLLRVALRASAVFLWAQGACDFVLLFGGEAAQAMDPAPARDAALAAGEPVSRDDGAHAWLAAASGLGALCVAAPAPRAFDDHDVETIRAAADFLQTIETRPRLPLQALVDLSGTMLREAEDAALPADTLRTAADSLDAVAGRLRELAAPSREPATTSETDAARILLADDLDLNRRLIADMLSLGGHRVDCVGDGAAAVRAVAAERYDLVLMDMIMPEMDGLAATRAIRALPRPAGDVPIVALTANTQPEQLDSCLAAGMDATLTKPMSLDALTSAVAHWTRGRHAA